MSELLNIGLASIELSQTESQKARRASFDKAGLEELAASVKADGIVVPVIVRPMPQKLGWHELVAGERRVIAAGMAKLEAIPAVVRELTDEQVVALQLIENLQREGLHPMHEAESYHALVHEFKHPIEDVIAQVGKSRTYVYSRMKLLALSKKCRKAFYDGKISASVAEKLARIPVEKTQDEALAEITRSDWNYRIAAETIRERFMLKLSDASFPTDVELAGAGPCGTCPKRTGNAPDLFDDIKSADVCTDTVCFAAKGRAYGQRVAEEARDRGQVVIAGAAAKKVIPTGIRNGTDAKYTQVAGGFRSIHSTEWTGKSEKKVSAIVGKDVERVLVVDGESGRTLEVVREEDLRKALGQRAPSSTSSRVGAAEKKRTLEKRTTFETYLALRSNLAAPSLFEIAGSLFRRLEHDAIKILCRVRDFEPPMHKEKYRGNVKDYAAVGAGLAKMSVDELELFINDCIYVRELMYGDSSYRDAGIPRIAELAKKHRVDVAKIRAGLAPKKKTKKKAAK